MGVGPLLPLAIGRRGMGARMSLGYGDITARAAARHSPASAGIRWGGAGAGTGERRQVEGRHCSFSPKHMHTLSALLTERAPDALSEDCQDLPNLSTQALFPITTARVHVCNRDVAPGSSRV